MTSRKAESGSPPDMSVADAAVYANVTGQHIRNMIADGTLVAYRLGRVIRLRRSDIDDALRRMN
ncbi:excisionase family DNA-binding protein [Mycolicibacterium sp. Dal123E01]|uniref:excisionase family DNA-binding protein n=1 Tax=Mycolicibacterium sp. Dal123E01 TaxID=3457578 RepID=UPI00403EE2A2